MDNALNLNILIIQGREDDVLLILRALHRGGIVPRWEQIQTLQELQSMLNSHRWDVILADYHLPQFDVLAALSLVQQSDRDMPFIMVSGTVGDSAAVRAMRAGAHDYVMKHNLTRLPEAIRREVQEARARTYQKQAELALKQTQERLQLAIEGSGIGLWDWLIQTNSLTVNEKWAEMLGYESAELTPITLDTWSSHVHPDDLDRYYAGLERHFSREIEVYEAEVRMRHRSGEWIWVLDRGKVVEWDAAGAPVRMTGTHLDITKRKRAEEALQAIQTRLLEAQRIAHIGNWEYRCQDKSWIWSDEVYRIFEIPPHHELTHALFLSKVHPEDRNRVSTFFLDCSNRPFHQIVYRLLLDDGRIKYVDDIGQTMFDDSGQPLRLTGTVQDITAYQTAKLEQEQAKVELEYRVAQRTAELQNSQHFSERIAQTTPQILYIYDLRSQTNVYTNREIGKVLGYTPEDIQAMGGGLLAAIVHPDDLAVVSAHHNQLINAHDNDILTLEYRLRDSQGCWHWFISRDVIFSRDQTNIPTQILGSAIDITDRKQAEEKLRKSEARYRALMDGASDAILLADTDGYLIEVNRKAEELLGYTRAELTQMHISQIHPPDTRAMIQADFQHILAGQLRKNLEVTIACRGGQVLPVEITATLIHVDGTTIVQGIFRDIRDRKAIEAALQRSQERTQATLRALPEMVFRVNQAGIYLDFSVPETMASLVNVKDAIGRTLQDTLPPDMAQQHYQALQQSLASQTVLIYEQRVWIHGSLRYEEVRVSPCGNDEAVFFIRDVTDRVEAEVQLKTSEAELQALFASISDAIIVRDRHGRCLKIAPCSTNLYLPSEQLIGRTWHETLPATTADYLLSKVHECLHQKNTVSAEYCLQIQNQPVYMLANISPLSDDAVVVVARDISDRKAYEAQLQQTNAELARATRLKDEFLANMSHELRTPLNAILGMTEALQDRVFGTLNERQYKSLVTIERSGQHLLDLINDILDLAKIESGRLELELTDISIGTLCTTSLSLVKQLAHQKQIHLALHLPDALANLSLTLDERRIRQVLLNLLSNAIKFTPKGGHVILRVQLETVMPPDGQGKASSILSLAVSDTGIGIAPENMSRLFQSFVQIDSKLNRKYEGTGLGLALVKRITEMHGGQVTVTSELNRGSCFTVKLSLQTLESPATLSPLPVDDRTVVQPTCPPVLVQQQTKVPTMEPLVLLVEDNEANRYSIAGYLEAKGYRLIVATDGHQAIHQVKQHEPDIILMDIQMPGVDGIRATQEIRSIPGFTHIPIVALTALAMPCDRAQCLAAGANAYLAKPVKLKELVTTIERLMKGA